MLTVLMTVFKLHTDCADVHICCVHGHNGCVLSEHWLCYMSTLTVCHYHINGASCSRILIPVHNSCAQCKTLNVFYVHEMRLVVLHVNINWTPCSHWLCPCSHWLCSTFLVLHIHASRAPYSHSLCSHVQIACAPRSPSLCTKFRIILLPVEIKCAHQRASCSHWLCPCSHLLFHVFILISLHVHINCAPCLN